MTVICYDDLELLKVLNSDNVDQVYPLTPKNENKFLVGNSTKETKFVGIRKNEGAKVGSSRGSSRHRNQFQMITTSHKSRVKN